MASNESSNMMEADAIYHQHENILDYIPVVQNQEFSILVQPAKSLKSFSLFRHGCTHEKFISFVVMGVLKALEFVHSRQNLVHGNINLNNVFLDKDCKVKLELPVRKISETAEDQKIDIRMVGELALCLFYGKLRIKYKFGCFSGNMKKEVLTGLTVRDFVKFCLNPSRTPTLREVMNHEFFKKFGEFDEYQQELKELLRKKLCKI